MINILAKQHVIRRKTSPLAEAKKAKKAAYRPAGFLVKTAANKNFIEQVRQKPSRHSRGQSPGRSPGRPGRTFPNIRKGVASFFRKNLKPSAPRQEEPERIKLSPAPEGQGNKKPRFISFPVLAGFPLLLFAAVFALNWEKAETIMSGGQALPAPPGNGGRQYDLAVYAGVPQTPGQAGENILSEGEIPLDLVETFAWENYKVKKDETVSEIAARHALSYDAVIASNNITNVKHLMEGQVLRIPNMDGIPYTVRQGDSLVKISQDSGIPVEAILDANDLQSDVITPGMSLFLPGARMSREDLKLALGELFIYPVKNYRLTSPFGWRLDPISGVRRHHAAIDMAAAQGTKVVAAMDGTVSTIGYNANYGNYIILSHSKGYQTLYAHLSAVSVKKGAKTPQGTKIGEVGSTGYSTGPHLHFAVYKNGRAIDPMEVLNT